MPLPAAGATAQASHESGGHTACPDCLSSTPASASMLGLNGICTEPRGWRAVSAVGRHRPWVLATSHPGDAHPPSLIFGVGHLSWIQKVFVTVGHFLIFPSWISWLRKWWVYCFRDIWINLIIQIDLYCCVWYLACWPMLQKVLFNFYIKLIG